MPDIQLLATDLDGTLIGTANEFHYYSEFRDRVQVLRRQNGTVWAACTGRSMKSFKRFFSPMRTMGLSPDFVIVNHAYIHSLSRIGYLPHLLWNLRIRYLLMRDFWKVRRAINDWHKMITGVSIGVKTIVKRENRLRLRFDSEESVAIAEELLMDKVKPYRHLKVFRYLLEIDVKAIPFTKGMALAELSHHLGIPAADILSIGDGHNDISMFEESVSANCGCPANAEAEVMEVVHYLGGHIARSNSLVGVIEVMDAFRDGKVHSELPEWWRRPSEGTNPSPQSRRGSHQDATGTRSFFVFVACVITVVMVFASLGLIPGGGLIMKPFYKLVQLVERCVSPFID